MGAQAAETARALKELPDAFTFKLAGEEAINGGDAYVIEGMPKPGYRPTNAHYIHLPQDQSEAVDRQDRIIAG